jgi:putative ABC transport system permease protein
VILGLAWKSLRNRGFTAVLTVISIALAVALLLGVERIRDQSRESFASTISGTDLIVGARTSPVHLLLFSVFRIGDATNNIRLDSYRAIAARPEVAWTIPLALGDSHRGFRVLGTAQDYFDHFRFARDRKLAFAAGHRFEEQSDAVLGADVAKSLGYVIGEKIVVAHGSGDVGFALHSDHPFRVVGILARTGTPVDRTIHVSLAGFSALHEDGNAVSQDPLAAARDAAIAKRHAGDVSHENDEHGHDATANTISAFLVGLQSRGAALSLQRQINQFPEEPLTAIMPGVTLLEVWGIVGVAESALRAVSSLVLVVGFAGMLVALLTSLSERRREMAVLRSVGARPMHVFGLILGEAAFLTLLGIALGLAALYIGLWAGRPWLESRLGLFIDVVSPSVRELGLIITIGTAGALIGLIPAYRIYRYSLADGMMIRV